MTDTNAKIQVRLAAMMRKKTGIERLKMGFSMFDMAKKLVVASIFASGEGKDIYRQLLLRFYRTDLDSKTISKILEARLPVRF